MKYQRIWLVPVLLGLASCGRAKAPVLPGGAAAAEKRWGQYDAGGWRSFEQGHYPEAVALLKLAVRQAEGMDGDGTHLVESLAKLAWVYKEQAKYADAESSAQRALAVAEKSFGAQDVQVAHILNTLAEIARVQRKFAEAESLFLRALANYETALGPEDAEVARALNNLGNLYANQGRHGDAQRLHQRALAIREKILAPDEPDVAQSIDNLANAYASQDKPAEAQPLYERALEIYEQRLGQEHPDVARCLNNLANLHFAQQKHDEAEPLYRRSLAIYEKALGADHPLVVFSVLNLANLFYAAERYDEAEPLYRRALDVREQTARDGVPLQFTSLERFATVLRKLDRAAEADELEQRYPEIYFARAVDTLAYGSGDAAEDAQKYLDQRGWRDELSQNLVLIAHFAHRYAARADEARAILDEAASRCAHEWWPYPVIRYLRGELAADALEAAATDHDKKTEVRAYLGLDLALSGRADEAAEHLRWVKDNGRRDFVEHRFAVAELQRLESKAAQRPQDKDAGKE